MRKVIDLEIDGIDTHDYPDFVDAYFSDGYWEDTGIRLTERELEELQDDNPDLLYGMVIERLF